MHADIELALEQIDAALFSGGTFRNPDNLMKLKEYLTRWDKEAQQIEEELAHDPS